MRFLHSLPMVPTIFITALHYISFDYIACFSPCVSFVLLLGVKASETMQGWRGILVKLVMLVSRGHWKNSIQTSWEKYSFSYLVPVYTDSNKKKTTVHLIAPFANILCIILTFQLSPWNTKKSKLFIKWHFWLPCTCISY